MTKITRSKANMLQASAIIRSVAAGAAMLLAAAAQAAQPPAGSFYQLTVTTSFEPSFTDCWAFASNGRFIVSHGGGLGTFPYQLAGLNTQAGHIIAAWRGRVSIAFNGVTSGSSIAGDATDTLDRTYSFTGTKVSACAAAAASGNGFQTR